MRVPSPTTGTTNLPRQSEKYLQAAVPDLSGLTRGLSALAGGLADAEAKKKAEADQLARFKATEGFVEFNANATARLAELKDSALPEDLNFAERAINSYTNYEDEFISTLPPDMQDEFRMRTASTRVAVADDATNFQKKNLQLYQKDSLGKMKSRATEEIIADQGNVDQWKKLMDDAIDNSAYSDIEKHYMKQENARLLETVAYKEAVREQRLASGSTTRIPLVVGTQAGRLPVDMSRLDPKVVDKWEHVQTSFGRAVPVVSAFRDPKRNAEAGGASKSRHQHGDAIDVDVSGMSKSERLRLIKLASAAGFNGVGVYDNSLHFDTAGKRAWGPSYSSDSIPEWAASTVSQHLQGSISKTGIMPLTGTELWARLEQAESGGRQSAVSPKGAVGVAQVMPATAPEAAALAGLPWDENKYRTDANYNRALGQAYLAKKMEEFGGDTAKALAAYNAGAGRVNEAVQKNGANWLSAMPMETQNYVQKILGSDTVDEDPRFSNVPYEDRVAVRQDVNTEITKMFAEQEKQRKSEHDARVNDLLVRVQAGQAGRTEYDQMVDEGLLPDYDERKKVLAALEERDKNGKVLRSAQERLARGAPFDPTDAEQKKELNALIGEEGIKKLQGRDAGYVSDELIPLFTKTGVLPGDVVGQLRGQAQSSNPLDMLYSFQALSLLENTNPVAYGAQVPDGLKHRADLWETLHGTVPDKELIDMLREAPTQALRDTKEYWMKEGEKLFSSPSEPVRFSDQFDDLGAPPSSPTMQVAEREWNTLFLENFTKTLGNKDAAIELTNKQFSRNWRKTGIDGAETLMKHPPELYTPTQYGTHEWLTNQVRGELALTDGERVVLVTDKRTEAEIAQAKAKGEKPDPSWLIMVQKENGLWVMARAPTGEALRHKFKPTPFDAKAHELDLRVESKKIELRGVMELMTTYGTSISGPPKEIADRAAKINGELEALKATRDVAAEDAKNFYQSPAAKEVMRLQKERTALLKEMENAKLSMTDMMGGTDPNSESQPNPLMQAFNALEEKLYLAERQAEIELEQKRTKVEGTP